MVENVLAEKCETKPEKKTKKVRKPFRFKVGDKVRLTYIRNPFNREYDEKWTREKSLKFPNVYYAADYRCIESKTSTMRKSKGRSTHPNCKRQMSRTTIFGKWKGF
jgi:hypothetical protein